MNTILQSPTPNLEQSSAFYRKLNWEMISDSPRIFTDGKGVMHINPVRSARAGLLMYKSSWAAEKEIIGKTTPLWAIDNGVGFVDPSGVWVYLLETESPTDYQPKEECFGLTGNFAGMSLESSNMQASADIYTTLGFKKTMGGAEQGWILYTNDEGFGVSIMKPNSCPHLFFNPSLTYFNGKEGNPIVIDNLRKAGIPLTEEITTFNKEGIVDNVIIRDPGGFGFFIFNDG